MYDPITTDCYLCGDEISTYINISTGDISDVCCDKCIYDKDLWKRIELKKRSKKIKNILKNE
jgi:hypothetical protein